MFREQPFEEPPQERGGEKDKPTPEKEVPILIPGFEMRDGEFPEGLEFMGHSFKLLKDQLRTGEAVYDRQGEGGEVEGTPQMITVNAEGRVISKTY